MLEEAIHNIDLSDVDVLGDSFWEMKGMCFDGTGLIHSDNILKYDILKEETPFFLFYFIFKLYIIVLVLTPF